MTYNTYRLGEPVLTKWPNIKAIRMQMDTRLAMFKRFKKKDEKIAQMKESSTQYVKDGKASGKASSASSAAPKEKRGNQQEVSMRAAFR
jgi:hypothetical protein